MGGGGGGGGGKENKTMIIIKQQKDECRVGRVDIDDPTEVKPPTIHMLQAHWKWTFVFHPATAHPVSNS